MGRFKPYAGEIKGKIGAAIFRGTQFADGSTSFSSGGKTKHRSYGANMRHDELGYNAAIGTRQQQFKVDSQQWQVVPEAEKNIWRSYYANDYAWRYQQHSINVTIAHGFAMLPKVIKRAVDMRQYRKHLPPGTKITSTFVFNGNTYYHLNGTTTIGAIFGKVRDAPPRLSTKDIAILFVIKPNTTFADINLKPLLIAKYGEIYSGQTFHLWLQEVDAETGDVAEEWYVETILAP